MIAKYFLASALAAVVQAGTLKEQGSMEATVYYDLTNSLCGDTFGSNWGETSGINNGIPFCQGQTQKSLKAIGTNQIVAMDSKMVQGDPARYCGREVEILKDGKKVELDEGPYILWDACEACSTSSKIDVSAKAFTQLKGGSCGGNNPGGLTVKILDNNIWTYGSSGGGGGGGGGGDSAAPAAADVAKPPPAANPIAQPPPSDPGSGSSGAPADCKFGTWHCEGNTLQICNNLKTGLGWDTVEACASKCQVTDLASVECH